MRERRGGDLPQIQRTRFPAHGKNTFSKKKRDLPQSQRTLFPAHKKEKSQKSVYMGLQRNFARAVTFERLLAHLHLQRAIRRQAGPRTLGYPILN